MYVHNTNWAQHSLPFFWKLDIKEFHSIFTIYAGSEHESLTVSVLSHVCGSGSRETTQCALKALTLSHAFVGLRPVIR